MFHKHNFKQHTTQKDIIFCECGKVKNVHQHIWEKEGEAETTSMGGNNNK